MGKAELQETLARVLKAVFTVALHCCLLSLRSWALLSSIATTDFIFIDWIRGEGECLMILWRGSFQFVYTTLLGNFTLHNSEVVIICVLKCSTERLFPLYHPCVQIWATLKAWKKTGCENAFQDQCPYLCCYGWCYATSFTRPYLDQLYFSLIPF